MLYESIQNLLEGIQARQDDVHALYDSIVVTNQFNSECYKIDHNQMYFFWQCANWKEIYQGKAEKS